MKQIPRWQQGPRPGAYGDVWDKMTPHQRRSAFFSDIIVAFSGATFVWVLFKVL